MPISLEPDKRFPIVLDCDIDKPEESRPTFYALSKSMRDHEDLAVRYDADHATVPEFFDAVCEILKDCIVDVKNMGKPIGEIDFRSLLTVAEARELIRKVMHNSHLTTEEKKS
jgi:hypothetical protein